MLDLAAPHAFDLGAFRLAPKEPPKVVTRGGQNYVELDQPQSELEFWLPEPLERTTASFPVRTHGPERISIAVDGERLGTVDLPKDEIRTVTLGPRPLRLARGRHTLRITRGRSRSSAVGLELSWIRLSEEADTRASSEPLGLAQVQQDLTLDGRPVHAWVFRDRMQVRCPLWVDRGDTRVLASLGVWGEGQASFDVRLIYPDLRERLLTETQFERGPLERSQSINTGPLEVEGEFVEIAFRARKVGAGSRIALSWPELEWQPTPPEPLPHAERAFVFILAGLSPALAPPHSARAGLAVLQEFAAESVNYPDYRQNSPSPNAALGSLLTGLPPWRHGATDSAHALRPELGTLATWFESIGGRAALFTGVPHSFTPFGVGRGFSRVEEVSPAEDRAATAPLEAFHEWLTSRVPILPRTLAVVHLRGGHPPFDIPPERAQLLPPSEYGGDLDPRRAAIQLANIRRRPRRTDRILPSEDWTRLEELRRAALEDQNLALRRTFAELRRLSLWDTSLVMVLGDAGYKDRPTVPYGEDGPLSEAELGVPLLIKFPNSSHRSEQVKGNFGPVDVFETLARSLGLPNEARAPSGLVLYPGAAPSEHARQRPHIAYFDGSYQGRLGAYLLSGIDGKAPNLCRVDWDPSCAQNRAPLDPLATSLLWGLVQADVSPWFDARAPHAPKVDLPDFTKNALIVWGALE